MMELFCQTTFCFLRLLWPCASYLGDKNIVFGRALLWFLKYAIVKLEELIPEIKAIFH